MNPMPIPSAIEGWRLDYNQVRPHSSLGNLTPREFAERTTLGPEVKTGELSDSHRAIRRGQVTVSA